MEMKKTLNQVKENLTQEGETLDSVQQDLRKTAAELREKMIDADPDSWRRAAGPADKEQGENVIAVEPDPVPPPADAPAGDKSTTESAIEIADTSETTEPPDTAPQKPRRQLPPAPPPQEPASEGAAQS